FSRIPLAALLQAGIPVRGVVVPATHPSAPDARPIRNVAPAADVSRGDPAELTVIQPDVGRGIVRIAWDYCIPVFEAGRLDAPETLTTLGGCRADLICVACFPRIFPPLLRGLPRLGGLNVHPSLLPKNRGPVPLFWTFRHGDPSTGVSIHWLDSGID